jgi:Yip1-like protein
MSEIETQLPEPSPSNGVPPPHEPAAVEEPAKLGPLSRLTGTLLSPGETFADINRKPTWIASLVIAIITAIAFSLFYDWRVKPDYLEITRQQMKERVRGGEMPPEETIKKAADLSSKINWVYAMIFPPIGMLFISGVFALCMLLMQAQTTFKKILSVVAWTFSGVGVVSTIVVAASVAIRDVTTLKNVPWYYASRYTATNLAAILSPDSPVLKAIAGSVDVFSIWRVVLLSIGLAAVAGSRKIKTRQTATLVVVLWLVTVLIGVAFAAMGFGA